MFCIQCGKQVVSDSGEAETEAARERNRTQNIIVIVVILGICAIAALLAVEARNAQNQKMRAEMFAVKPSGSYSHPLITPTPRPTPYWKSESYQIKRQAIALAPGQFWWQPLRVEEHWRGARLVGRFTAQGGSGNDIYACVTDEDGLTNLKNNHGYKVWYKSGKVTVDTINALLPTGQSYFVLSNKFSVFAHKSVMLDLRVEYERLVQP